MKKQILCIAVILFCITMITFVSASTFYVNQSGGAGYIGWNTWGYPYSTDIGNNNFPIQYSNYTTAQKNEVSYLDSGYVRASAYSGADCSAKSGAFNISCTSFSISECTNFFVYTSSAGSTCQWIAGPNICVPNIPCTKYIFHKFIFNVTKTGVTNLTVYTNIKQANLPSGSINTDAKLYIWNYTGNSYDDILTVNCKNITFCNLTYSTTNLNYISSGNQVQVAIMDTPSIYRDIDEYFVQINATYTENCWTYSNGLLHIPRTCNFLNIKLVFQEIFG